MRKDVQNGTMMSVTSTDFNRALARVARNYASGYAIRMLNKVPSDANFSVFIKGVRRVGSFKYCSNVKADAYPPSGARAPKLKTVTIASGATSSSKYHRVAGASNNAVGHEILAECLPRAGAATTRILFCVPVCLVYQVSCGKDRRQDLSWKNRTPGEKNESANPRWQL